MEKKLTFKKDNLKVNIEINLNDGVLSIVGEVKKNNKTITCGQCLDDVKDIIPNRLFEIWETWHLNDLRAGTPAQEEILRDHGVFEYTQAVQLLRSHGLLIDNGYTYGTKWLRQELPSDVVEYIESL